MTVALALIFGLVSGWVWGVEAGSSKVELVVRPRGEDRLLRRGNATVEYLKYAAQSYNALTTIGQYSFLLSLDTGSADTWVVSSSCHTSECKGLPTYPDYLASPTFGSINNNETAFRIGFADGTRATGFVASERMGVGGFNLTSQVFGIVNDTNVTLAAGDHEASGVLGLGFPRLSQIGKSVRGGELLQLGLSSITECLITAVPPVARLAQQGLLSYPIFGLSLRKNDTGTLSLGAIDADVVKNQSLISWHDVAPFPTLPNDNSSIYLQWAIHLSSVAINGVNVTLNSTYPAITGPQPPALFDVGANGIFGPAADVAELFSQIPASRLVGDGQYAIPCDTTSRMTFTFGYGIDTKEPPKIGLYPLSPDVVLDTEETISQSLSVESATYATTLPNYVLPTPTYTTPPYLFSPTPSTQSGPTTTPSPSGTATTPTSTFEYSIPTLGEPASSGLGASTYSALLMRTTPLPSAHPPVVVVTDSNGSATTQAMPMQSVILGGPEKSLASRQRTFGFGLSGALFVVYIVLLI
ncbi:unnamed protein product [Rhizoctonia solani]|uniref:Peptidase A1 domain-containing protein n=1 Tax=Rhizoctonia solani TaxID=456999 RepID=A0A8H3DXS0_9AGAM|nr:unnamed protein product [Rhizoctonia solani]